MSIQNLKELWSVWDKILAYYEHTSQMPRKGEIWDNMHYHCEKIQVLIPKIREHHGLSALEHRISVAELCLANPENERGALIFMERDDKVRITFYKLGELLVEEKTNEVHVHLNDTIQVLESNLLSL